MSQTSGRREGFDPAAAITRSLLGYGVLSGAVYLVVGLVLALTREGFDLSRHALSLLMLGSGGWMQRANLIVVGIMTVAAGVGFVRAMRLGGSRGRAGTFVMVFGVCLFLSGIFAPDPMGGFPPGVPEDEASVSGILHLAFGGLGFISLSLAALAIWAWASRDGGERSLVAPSLVASIVIVAGFVAGAALATSTAGVVSLWVAVVVGWAWLALTSIRLYRLVPHPDADRRGPTTA